MKLRRWAILAITICLLLSLFTPVPVAQSADKADLDAQIIYSSTYNIPADLSGFDLSVDELTQRFSTLYFAGKLPWYTCQNMSYSYQETTGIVQKFIPSVILDGKIDQALYEQQVAQILDVCVLDGMQQWQIALSIHDYLVANIRYDESLTKYTPYEALVGGSSVCAGYAKAYQDLLQRAGIDCLYVASEDMDHAWNLVKIDGQWYHVDVTWNDPTPDKEGYVSHEYFLRTDEEIRAGEKPHYNWNTNIACTDTRFSNGFWLNVESPICYENSTTCYLVRTHDFISTVYRRSDATGVETAIYKEPQTAVDIGKGNYLYSHFGLTLQGGKLYFSTTKNLLSMDTDGTNVTTVYAQDVQSSRRYIAGSFVSGDTARLSLSDHSGITQLATVPLSVTDLHTHSYTKTQVPSNCTIAGYTLSSCSCGIQCKSDPKELGEHSYKPAAHANSYSCEFCGDSYSDPQPAPTDPPSENGGKTGIAQYVFTGIGVIVAVFVLLLIRARFC